MDDAIPVITRALPKESRTGNRFFELYAGDTLIGWTAGRITLNGLSSCHAYGTGEHRIIRFAPTVTVDSAPFPA